MRCKVHGSTMHIQSLTISYLNHNTLLIHNTPHIIHNTSHIIHNTSHVIHNTSHVIISSCSSFIAHLIITHTHLNTHNTLQHKPFIFMSQSCNLIIHIVSPILITKHSFVSLTLIIIYVSFIPHLLSFTFTLVLI